MLSLAEQLTLPTDDNVVRPDFAAIRARGIEARRTGQMVFVSQDTFAALQKIFGPKLRRQHLRQFFVDLASGQYKLVRIKPAKAVKPQPQPTPALPAAPPTADGPVWTLHQLAAEFSVPYHAIIHRVRQGQIVATRIGKRRFHVSNAEVMRLRAVGIR